MKRHSATGHHRTGTINRASAARIPSPRSYGERVRVRGSRWLERETWVSMEEGGRAVVGAKAVLAERVASGPEPKIVSPGTTLTSYVCRHPMRMKTTDTDLGMTW